MRTIGRWLKRLVLAAAAVIVLGIAIQDVQIIRTLYAYVNSGESGAESVSSLLSSVDTADLIENWSGVVSSVTGVEYEVVETESGTMIEISAEELSDLARTVQNYVEEEELNSIAAGYGIDVDAIAAGDYSSLGLTGDETLQISEEELQSVLSMVQQYMSNG